MQGRVGAYMCSEIEMCSCINKSFETEKVVKCFVEPNGITVGFLCPECDKVHRHGAGGGWEGGRSSHCGAMDHYKVTAFTRQELLWMKRCIEFQLGEMDPGKELISVDCPATLEVDLMMKGQH